MKCRTVVLACLVLLASIACSKTIVVAVDPTYPPMESLDEKENLVGFDIDLMNAIAEAGNFTVHFRSTPWDQIFSGLGAGTYDAIASSVSILDDRRASMDFSVPYLKSAIVLVVRASEGVVGVEDLSGKTVATQSGGTPFIAVLNKLKDQQRVTPRLYEYVDQGLDDLAKGIISGFIYDSISMRFNSLKDVKYRDTLKVLAPPLADDSFGIAVKKGNTSVLSMINVGLKKVIDSGKITQLEQKWLK